MRILSICLALLGLQIAQGQGYWQQKINYQMEIDFDTSNHQFKGHQVITYWNNSPDTLEKVFYHLYYNAFQPNSMMDVRSRTIKDPDGRVKDRILHLSPEEIGYQKILKMKQDGKKINFIEDGTILEVPLKKALLPGTSTVIEMDFEAQVPVQIRRTGRHNKEGIDYSMTQWYPKLAEYDKDGWASNPYVGREFHGVWGDFDVKITIDKGYVLGGTGYLQNPQEIGYGYEDKSKPVNQPKGDKLTWHFNAPNVHDFAWAADPNFAHLTDTINNGTVLHFIFDKDTLYDYWDSLRPYAKQIFEIANENFGEYPYKQYSVIQGGDGGMEYPMATLITAHGSFKGLVSVTAHEAMHSWYQGMMASNEAKYPWLDEGFTSYAQAYILDKVWGYNQKNVLSRSYRRYAMLVKSGNEEPLTTHADAYMTNGHYGANAYSKGSILEYQLSYVIGKAAFEKGLISYYNTWRFKHPTPDDFKRVMEKVSGMELDWYFEHFIGTTNYIDYQIKQVNGNKGKTSIVLERLGEMPMPIDVEVMMKDSTTKVFNIPMRIMRGEKKNDIYKEMTTLEDWPWTFPLYEFEIDVDLDEILSITIDPSYRMADIDRKNNIYPSYQNVKYKN